VFRGYATTATKLWFYSQVAKSGFMCFGMVVNPSGGPLFSTFGNLGVVGDLSGGSVITHGHGNFNCFRGPVVLKKKYPSQPDTANESLHSI
jgi:hypothetical protein